MIIPARGGHSLPIVKRLFEQPLLRILLYLMTAKSKGSKSFVRTVVTATQSRSFVYDVSSSHLRHRNSMRTIGSYSLDLHLLNHINDVLRCYDVCSLVILKKCLPISFPEGLERGRRNPIMLYYNI